jgi:hypothetical protein
MIKTVFTFFQMQIESFRRHAIELVQSSFGMRPETFNAVDVNIANSKNILRVINAKMFAVSDINQSIVAAPTVRMNHRIDGNTPANNVLQRFAGCIRDNFSKNRAVSFVDSEDDSFISGSATALAANPARTEIRLVNFNLTRRKGRRTFRFLGDSVSDFQVNSIDASVRQFSQPSSFISRQIKGEILDDLPSFSFANFSIPIISV